MQGTAFMGLLVLLSSLGGCELIADFDRGKLDAGSDAAATDDETDAAEDAGREANVD